MREGRGTIIAFSTTSTGYFLNFKRESGFATTRIIAPEVADALAHKYGVRDHRNGAMYSMEPLKEALFRYRETSQGMLVAIDILPS